jgi:hypothetical protein
VAGVAREVTSVSGNRLLLDGNLGVLHAFKLAKVDFRVVSSKSESLGGERERHKVNPRSYVESVEHSVHFLSHFGEGASSAASIIGLWLISRSHLDDTIHSTGGKGSA